jgi:hypothetical protein
MSDRTPSSVRTGSPNGETAAPTDTAQAEPAPVTSTQAIPTTGSQRAAAGGSSAAVAAPSATQSAAPAGAPTVPPTTGAGPVVPPSGASPAQSGSSTAVVGSEAAGPSVEPTASTKGRGRGPAKSRGPRRARLQLRHIDTWSALKISLVLSIALFFIWMVAVGVLYGVLSALGVFDTLNDLFGQLGSASGSGGGGGDVVTPGLVFGGAAVIGAINIVLMTALCTVGTFIYNLCSDLVGGLEVTLSERD